MDGRPTLRDVARRSGVSISTASRALTRPGRVAPETAERVIRASDELGYRPDAHGRALRSGNSRLVALVVPDTRSPFFLDLIRGTQLRLRDEGYGHLLVDTGEAPEVEEEALRSLRGNVDGAILGASRLSDRRLAVWESRLPIVTINRARAAVVTDTADGAGQALRHVAGLGHREIAYLGGPEASWSNARRLEVLRSLATSLGVELRVLGPFEPRREWGRLAALAALESGATAFLAFNDLLALGVLEELRARGVAVPADRAIVGCDDIFGADFVGLTTIHVPVEEAAAIACGALLRRIGGDLRTSTHVLPTTLVVRSTTQLPSSWANCRQPQAARPGFGSIPGLNATGRLYLTLRRRSPGRRGR